MRIFTGFSKRHTLAGREQQYENHMKPFFTILSFFSLMLSPVHAQEDALSYMDSNIHPGETLHMDPQERQEVLEAPAGVEDNDPFEPLNRGIFWFNDILDTVIFDPVSAVYKGVFPEFVREHIGYILRNLSEPIVFTNNILQGELGDAEDTLRRFLINSTVGLAGIFDVSTDLDIPYKKEDFGLTLASWGVEAGPYLVLPILGPSNVRDTFGRIGDYSIDPINWVAFADKRAFYSYARTAAQVIDAKTDNYEIIEDLRKNSLDAYATFRTWYDERRKSLINKNRSTIDSPHPDEEDDEEEEDKNHKENNDE